MTKTKTYPSPTELLPCAFVQSVSDNNPKLIDWSEAYRIITSDSRLIANTMRARQLLSEGNTAAYSRQKSLAGAIVPAVQCEGGRRAENIIRLTGASLVDLDHVPDERLEEVERIIKSDPHTLLYHRTASGHGCRIFFRYRCEGPEVAYLSAWQWGNEYYSMTTGCDHDPATKDPNRLSFLTHDADAFFNLDAVPFAIAPPEEASEADTSVSSTLSAEYRVQKAEELLARQGIAFAEGNRHYYLMQLAILLLKYGLSAEETLAAILPRSPRGEKEARDLAGWVYSHYADKQGVWLTGGSFGSRPTTRKADGESKSGNSRNYASVEEIRAFLKQSNRLRHNVISGNLELFSAEQGQFVDIDDRASNTLWHDCNLALGKYVRTQDFDREIHSEAIPLFDPFEAFFEALPPWDGKDHIAALAGRVHTSSSEVRVQNAEGNKDFLSCADVRQHVAHPIRPEGRPPLRVEGTAPSGHIGSQKINDDCGSLQDCNRDVPSTRRGGRGACDPDGVGYVLADASVNPKSPLPSTPLLPKSEPLFCFCFRKWFVAMVASWRDPKILNQTILTFIGGQGLYKSTFFRRLLPPELERYFLAKGNATYVSKDDKIAVSSYALIDFEEIDSMKDADLNAVKALVTTEVIAERAAYARNRENRPHLASFCATGNNLTFLTDLTGNRRWLPFHVQSIDSPYDNPIDYPQLYAQALALAEGGFRHWFSRDEDQMLEAHKASFAEPCLEEELVSKYFRLPKLLEVGQFYSTTEIVARCSAEMRGQLQAKRMAQALQRLGFRQKKSGAKRGYILVEKTLEEIQMDRVAEARKAIKEANGVQMEINS